MANYSKTLPALGSAPEDETSGSFELANLVGLLDVLVQMDLALNGYPIKAPNTSPDELGGNHD